MSSRQCDHFIIRPVLLKDLTSIFELSRLADPGLTSLTSDKAALSRLIQHSISSFKKTVSQPDNEFYLFVLEDIYTKSVIGTASIWSRIGIDSPFYSYTLSSYKRSSDLLNTTKYIQLLSLSSTRYGPSEIGTLFLSPKYRRSGLGRLLSFSRFLFMAMFPERFDVSVIAEMRGVSNASGISPFWSSLGKHFFDLSFTEADMLSSKTKQFIGDLMPRYPFYVNMLSSAAQAVIGKPHPKTKPAYTMLRDEGFSLTSSVDIFDAGPKLSAITSHIRCIKDHRVYRLSSKRVPSFGDKAYLVCRPSLSSFKVIHTYPLLDGDKIYLPSLARQLLKTRGSDLLSCVSVYSDKKEGDSYGNR